MVKKIKKEVREKELFKLIDQRLMENDKRGIDSIVVYGPDNISVIGLDPLNTNILKASRKK